MRGSEGGGKVTDDSVALSQAARTETIQFSQLWSIAPGLVHLTLRDPSNAVIMHEGHAVTIGDEIASWW